MRLALVALTLLLALPASAAPILDVDVAPTSGGVLNVDNDANGVQAFSVSTSGMLVRIDVFAVNDFATCSEYCGLMLGAGPAQLSSVATSPHSDAVLGDWIEFTLETPRAVLLGDTLRFDVEHDNFIVWGSGTYSPGVEWACLSDGCSHPLNPNPFDHSTDVPEGAGFSLAESYAFRVWIEPSAVPEPTGLALAAAALAGARSLRRRRAPQRRR